MEMLSRNLVLLKTFSYAMLITLISLSVRMRCHDYSRCYYNIVVNHLGPLST